MVTLFFILYIIVNQIIKMIFYTFSSVEFWGICGKIWFYLYRTRIN